MSKRILLALLAGLLTGTAWADATEAGIKKAVEAAMGPGAKVDNVRKAGVLNLYEVQMGGDILYTDEKAVHFVIGHIIDPKNRKDLTQERLDKLSQVKFSELPLELAIKQVKGNGKRQIATFEDPNCTYCKKLAKELQGVTDVTIYTFMMPILSQDSTDKSKAIWCAPDRAKAWNDYMINGKAPAAASCDTSGVDKAAELGRRLNIRGTPAIVLADGTRIPGFMPAQRLEEAMNRAAEAK
jgi:thiol:disulfide interchange protein DsbC